MLVSKSPRFLPFLPSRLFKVKSQKCKRAASIPKNPCRGDVTGHTFVIGMCSTSKSVDRRSKLIFFFNFRKFQSSRSGKLRTVGGVIVFIGGVVLLVAYSRRQNLGELILVLTLGVLLIAVGIGFICIGEFVFHCLYCRILIMKIKY